MNNILLMKPFKALYYTIFAVFIISIAGCSEQVNQEESKPLIVCTTSIIADAVQEIMGEDARIETLMGIGVDPHLYKATTRDVQWMKQADIIIYNGLHLEGKLADLLEKFKEEKKAYAVAESLAEDKLIAADDYSFDPHVWFDLNLWSVAVESLGNHLIFLFAENKAHEKMMEDRLENYLNKLALAHKSATSQLSMLEENRRYLITAHDAFSYFGRAYGLEVKPLQGISTASEFGVREINELVDFMVEKNIPTLFVENSVSPKALRAVIEGCRAKGHTVKEGAVLYSDALGAEKDGHHTLIGAFSYNVEQIFKGLK